MGSIMSYKVIKFEKDTTIQNQEVFVAIIQRDEEPQPFKMVLEHFDTPEEARLQAQMWIERMEEDERIAIAENERMAKSVEKDLILDELNSGLSNVST